MIELDWLTEDEQRVYRAFSAMSRELFNHFDCDLKADVGIPRTYYELLFVLGDAPDGGLRLTDLARATRSNASRITYAVDRLERQGLLRRVPSPDDGRAWHAELTEAGAETLRNAARRHARGVREYLLDALTERQREELRRISDKVLSRIGVTG